VTRRLAALALGAGATCGLVACGNSGPSHHTTTTTTSRQRANSTSTTATTTTTTSTSISTTTTSTTTATATSVTTTACNRISASAGQRMGAAGTITGVITLTNTGGSTCIMNGYPVMALFSGSGAPLVVTMTDGLTVHLSPAANGPPAAVSVPPSGTAQFAFEYSDVPVGSETSCSSSEVAETTAPGARVPSPNFALAADPCDNGTIRVSPVYPTS
jgi:hypothetical protein